MNIGLPELLVIFGVVLLVVGARRLPEIGRALGEAVKEFQNAVKGTHRTRDSSDSKK